MFAIAFPAIDPVAVEIGPLAIRWYALAYVAGILVGWRYMIVLARRLADGIAARDIDDFVLWATLGIVLGGRLGYVLFYRPGDYLQDPLAAFALWQGGMSFHGGLCGVVIAAALFARRRGIPWLALGDLVSAAAPIGLFFGRLANFVNGELYGRPTTVPWGMVFPGAGPEPRHPSQLYEAALEGLVLFAVCAVVVFAMRGLERTGLVGGVFLAGYAIARGVAELFRQPDAHLGFLAGGATMGQLLSIPVLIAGIWLIRRARAR
ncbi:MAG: prolipoprotein diacylglyceryl transferase [Defluviicoccus sp.]|nr:prolipoprotein diacylglyceryl transferase [Defluviicoccus sp.]MDE0277327.1 prolipoprotein diacylglyceryl transferase [Defluviicoccus sp.]